MMPVATETFNEVTPGGRVIQDSARPQPAGKLPTEEDLRKYESLQLVPFKEGFYAIAGPSVALVRSQMTEDEKQRFTFKYDGDAKGWTIPVSQAFSFQDVCKAKGVEATFAEKV